MSIQLALKVRDLEATVSRQTTEIAELVRRLDSLYGPPRPPMPFVPLPKSLRALGYTQ
jgi:hypothetical protein